MRGVKSVKKLINVDILFEENDIRQMTIEQALLLLQCDKIGYEGNYHTFTSKFEINEDKDYSLSIVID